MAGRLVPAAVTGRLLWAALTGRLLWAALTGRLLWAALSGLVVLAGLGVPAASVAGASARRPPALPARDQPPALPAGDRPPVLQARAAALMDVGTGQILYGKADTQELSIASTTKLMTALVVLQREPLTAVFTEPDLYFSPVDSQIGLVPGERMTVHDLLLALLLPSADDAAADLAAGVGHGSIARFVALMNAQASRLGLSDTHYTTPSGLDTPGNYSTADDLLRLARYDLRTEPFLRRAVALPRASLRSGNALREITNRNDLVGRIPWIDGVKTGHTQAAGYVLVASGTRNGMTLLSVVLGTSSPAQRDSAGLALLYWGFGHFAPRTLVRAGQVIARPRVRHRPGVTVPVLAAKTVRSVLARGEPVQLRPDVSAVSGPLRRGAPVGRLTVLAGGRVVGSVALVLARAVARYEPTRFSVARMAIPITLVSALLLAAGLAWFARRGGRAPGAEGRRAR